MLKTKSKGVVIVLLNAALITAPVQMSLASTSINSHNHGTNNQKVKPCQHAKKSHHSSKGHNKTTKSSHHHVQKMVQKMNVSNVEKMSAMNEMEQQACQCTNTCADCCGGHATVALHEVEFYQFTKADSIQSANKLFHYKQISLPIENPPPMA